MLNKKILAEIIAGVAFAAMTCGIPAYIGGDNQGIYGYGADTTYAAVGTVSTGVYSDESANNNNNSENGNSSEKDNNSEGGNDAGDVNDDNKDDNADRDEDFDIISARRHNIGLMECVIDSVTYTGNPVKPKVVIIDEYDNRLLENTDYTVTFYDNLNVTGYYKGYRPRAVITGKGDYFGTFTVYFDIKPKKIDDCKYMIGKMENYTYTGNPVLAGTQVTVDSKVMHEDIDYTVSYTDNKKSGKATARMKFFGNYTGTLSAGFYITPKTAIITGYKCSDNKSAAITWNKEAQADGYILYRYDDNAGKYVQIKKIDNVADTSAVITGLSKGQRVKLRIRTYKTCSDNKVIYSDYFTYSFLAGKQVTAITNAYNEKNITVAKGQKRDIVVNVAPSDACNKNVIYKSSNPSVAKVSNMGVVTGVTAGDALISVLATDGSNVTYTIKVKVTARAKSFTPDMKKLDVVSTDHQKYSYEEMISDIGILSKKYSRFIRTNVLGKSYDNRLIYDIAIGNKNSKKQVIIVGSTHAREYMNSMLIMKQIEMYCNYYYEGMYDGKYFSEIFDDCCIHFVPMLNPDGVTISQFGPQKIKDAALRANLNNMFKKYGNGVSRDTYFRRWKANGRGVDLNRNYYVKGGKGQFGKGHPCDQGYYGPSAGSEKETKCLISLFNNVKPAATISYHSTGSQIYWKYGQTGTHLANSKILFETVRQLTGYEPIGHVSTGPGFSDWVSSIKGTPAMTVETGKGMCPLGIDEFASVWAKNKLVPVALARKVVQYTM